MNYTLLLVRLFRCRAAVAVIGLLSLLMLHGCITLIPSPFRPFPGPQKHPQAKDLAEAFDIVCRNYRLGPGDQMSVLFQTEWTMPAGAYRLDTLDRIAVKFILDPQLNEDVVIRPDGMITLQAVGEIQAAGVTPLELAQRIEQKFLDANIFSKGEARGDLKNYKLVTVHVLSFFEKVNKLSASLQTLTGGAQTTLAVKPDGTIDLPLVKDRILCAGFTVSDVENTVNRLYRGILDRAVASVRLTSAVSRNFYILGEAGNGAFVINQPITILHALAMVGGATVPSADLTSVILISRDVHGKPIGRRVDVKRMLDVGDLGENILIKPYDVIYVPRTYIQDVRLFIDQYLSVITDIKAFANNIRR